MPIPGVKRKGLGCVGVKWKKLAEVCSSEMFSTVCFGGRKEIGKGGRGQSMFLGDVLSACQTATLLQLTKARTNYKPLKCQQYVAKSSVMVPSCILFCILFCSQK